MALQLSVETEHGLQAPGAYHRVEGPVVQGKTTILFRVTSFASRQAALDFKPPFGNVAAECAYKPDGPNLHIQAYLALKALPGFADAVDV